MGVRNRLIEFVKYNNLGQAAFERKVGLSNGFVNNIGDSIRKTSLEKIMVVFPDLNPTWLVMGEGSMLKGQGACTSISGGVADDTALRKEVEDLRILLEAFKAQNKQLEAKLAQSGGDADIQQEVDVLRIKNKELEEALKKSQEQLAEKDKMCEMMRQQILSYSRI